MHLGAGKCILAPEGLKPRTDPVQWRHTKRKGTVTDMGMTAFLILTILEIALAVRTCRKKPDRKTWCRERLVLRAAEAAAVVLHLVFSPAQKWRFVPVLGFLAVLLVIAALALLLGRKRESDMKKPAGAVVGSVLCVLLFAFLLVPACLFTGYNGLPVSGAHPIGETSAILVDASRTDPFEQDGSFREVPVHFYYPADAAAGERFPLVVFSHGAFGYYQSNTSTYMELASNGYVVAALDHPHHAFFTQDTDGKTVLVDTAFLNAALNLNDSTDKQEQFALYREWMGLRVPDMNFALDAIKAAAENGTTDGSWFVPAKESEKLHTALAMTDVSRIGLMGHSMGGATSVQLGRERSDVAAVIDLDGTMLGEYLGVENGEMLVSRVPYPVPVLDFNNWESYIDMEEYRAQGYPYPNVEVVDRAETGFSVGIRDAKHMDFTDLPLLSPTLGKMLGSGARSTEEIMTAVNSLVLQFFNCYLKGEGDFTVHDTY